MKQNKENHSSQKKELKTKVVSQPNENFSSCDVVESPANNKTLRYIRENWNKFWIPLEDIEEEDLK